MGERSRSLALVYSGMYSGSIMGLALSPHMVARLQWPSVFYVFGFIGIFWFLAWEKNASSSPAVDNRISKEEKDYITSKTIKQVGSWWMFFMQYNPQCKNPCTQQKRL